MTSKNSFSSLLRQDIKSKLWLVLLNTIIMFFNFTMVMAIQVQRVAEYIKGGNYTHQEVIDILTYYIGGENRTTIFVTLLMASAAAFSQFGYLHQKEQVDFYHSLPIRRQKRFLVRFINGLFIYMVPYLVFCLSGLAIVSAFGYANMEVVTAAFLGFFVNTVGYVLCYSTAILSVCLTGNLFAGICGICTLFGYGYLIAGLATVLMGKYSMSYIASYGKAGGLCSVLSPLGAYVKLVHVVQGEDSGNPLAWILGCMIAAALLIAVILWTYLKRKSESAGKSMAFEKSKGVIKAFIMTAVVVAGTLFFWSVGYNETIVWAIIGFVITLVLSHMVIQIVFELDIKAIKTGMKSAIISMAIAILVFFGFDIAGEKYDNYEINWEQMEYAAVNLGYFINYSYNESEYDVETGKYISAEEYAFEHMKISDKELLRDFTKACIESQKEMKKLETEDRRASTYVSVKYTLKDGRIVYRAYEVAYDVVKTYILQFVENQEYRQANSRVFHADIKDVTQIKYYDEWSGNVEKYLDMSTQEREELIEIYREEYSNATAEELNTQVPVASFVLVANDEYKNGRDIATAVVYPSFVKTIEKLEEKGMKCISLQDLSITELKIYCYRLDNQMLGETLEITYTEAEKIEELQKHICLGEYGYYTAFTCDYNIKSDYEVLVQLDEKERGDTTQSAMFIKEIPEWVKEDLKNKQIEQEIDKVE